MKSVLLVVAFLTGCGTILGLQEPTVNDSLGDGSSGDGTPQDGMSQDGTPQGDGGCAHDCLGGACIAGVCQPVLVTQSTSLAPYAMVLDGTTLYFANVRGSALATVYKIDKTATNGTATLLVDYNVGYPSATQPMTGLPYDIAVQGGFFYVSLYAGSGMGGFWEAGIDRCPVTGCTQTTIAYYGINSYAVVASSTNVFFGSADSGDNYTLQKAAPNLSGRAALTVPSSEVNGLAMDGADVYYASADGVFHCGTTCDTAALTQGQSLDAEQLALDTTTVYFTSTPFSGTATVQSVPRAGGPPKLISGKPAIPFAVATDGTNVYFTDVGDITMPSTGAVYVCPVAGCANAEVQLSNGPSAGDNPRPIVSDTNAIYWGTRGGSIWRLAK